MELHSHLERNLDDAYDHVIAHLKEKKIRITESRKAIISYMIHSVDHPSAEMIYRDLKPKFPNLSLATVYNNIRFLVDEGFVSEIKPSNDNTTYFDFMGHKHLNVVCEQCGNITDFMDIDFSLIQKEAAEQTNYNITKTQFLIYGICPECQLRNRES